MWTGKVVLEMAQRSEQVPYYGALAQLGEHLLCKQGVIGSIPIGSTKSQSPQELAKLIPRATRSAGAACCAIRRGFAATDGAGGIAQPLRMVE